MASIIPTRREAIDELSLPPAKKVKLDGSDHKHECQSCNESKPLNQFPKISPNCRGRHGRDVCEWCWRRYFKTDIMERRPGDIPCMLCGEQLDYEAFFFPIAKKDKIILPHYEWRWHRFDMLQHNYRECLGNKVDEKGKLSTCRAIGEHDPSVHDRLFKCAECGTEECTKCNLREHVGETCVDFQTRMQREHGNEEAATAQLFATNLNAATAMPGHRRGLPVRRRACPSCGIMTERMSGGGGGCDLVTCRAEDTYGNRVAGCGMQFCIFDGAKYLGQGSVPDVGKAAHAKGCQKERDRDEDRRYRVPATRAGGGAV